MSASAKRVVLACVDPRILDVLYRKAKEGLDGNKLILLTEPGAAIYFQICLPRLEMAVNVLGADEVWLVQHEDCQGCIKRYGEEKKDMHLHHLNKAGLYISENFPSVTRLRLFYMALVSDDEWTFEEIRDHVPARI